MRFQKDLDTCGRGLRVKNLVVLCNLTSFNVHNVSQKQLRPAYVVTVEELHIKLSWLLHICIGQTLT